MPLFRRPAASRHAWALFFVALGTLHAGACSASAPKPTFEPPRDKRYWSNSPKKCGVDEVREYFCDELLPLASALPAPGPYENCPGSIEQHVGLHQPLPPVALFDEDYTGYIRRRMPPGNSCCYSWCGPIRIVSLADVAPNAGCGSPLAFRETYCFEEPEGGTNSPAGSPLDHCPVAIAPPEGAAFAVPKAAPLDPQASWQKRQQGFKHCCYAWCSTAPAGTGLERR